MADTMLEPQEIARTVARAMADDPDQVGEFVEAIAMGDGVTDFRFTTNYRGYEGWQWSVTLYHDEEVDRWTVNESSLIPTDAALRPPEWVPWKDRLEPSDLSVTDAIGTEDDDPRLEAGFRRTRSVDDAAGADGVSAITEQRERDAAARHGGRSADEDDDLTRPMVQRGSAGAADAGVTGNAAAGADGASHSDDDGGAEHTDGTDAVQSSDESANAASSDDGADAVGHESAPDGDADTAEAQPHARSGESDGASAESPDDMQEAVEEFDLSRRHVMSPLGRAQTAKRWYEGPRGPKSLSTRTASGHTCSTCGFFIPLKGELNLMFGVCANKWSPDDGRVVSLDHGCGEHSEIDPPEPTHLWVQSKPAFDDLHIDIIAHAPREERAEIELIERMSDRDEDEATDEDIDANVTAEDDDETGNDAGGPQVESTLDLGDESTDDDSESDTDDDGRESGEPEHADSDSEDSGSDDSGNSENAGESDETGDAERADGSGQSDSQGTENVEASDGTGDSEMQEESGDAEHAGESDGHESGQVDSDKAEQEEPDDSKEAEMADEAGESGVTEGSESVDAPAEHDDAERADESGQSDSQGVENVEASDGTGNPDGEEPANSAEPEEPGDGDGA